VILMTVKYRIREGFRDFVLEKLREMKAEVARTEPGCRLYQVGEARDQPDLFIIVEVYDDEIALDAHRNTPHFERLILGEIVPRLHSRDREMYEMLID